MTTPDSDAVAQPPNLDALAEATLLVPIRSSTGAMPDGEEVQVDDFRHGTDEQGERFLAAFTGEDTFAEFGPPGSDRVALRGRDLFARAEVSQVRLVIDPGAPTQLDIPEGLLPFLAAGIDPNRPDALRARRPLTDMPSLEAPDEIPEPLGAALRAALAELRQVERAWLLRSGDGWTAGIQMAPEAVLAEFDAVRNRLHAVANEELGSRRLLAVTDLRAPALRETYDATAAPFYVRAPSRTGFFARLFGR